MEKKSYKNLVNVRVKKTKKLAKILQFVPFISCLILNGSLSEGKTKKGSDIDLLTIVRPGRVFTVRFIMGIITALLGWKRSSSETKNHAGKFCFNYYLTDEFLEIPHDRAEEVNAYCAKNYSQSILVWGDRKIFHEYYKMNYPWMEKYLENQKSNTSNISHSRLDRESTNVDPRLRGDDADMFPLVENFVSRQFPVGNIRGRRVGEWWERRLAGRFGDWFELRVKKIQIYLIERDGRTWKYPEYIVYNDRELRFHPPKKAKRADDAGL